MLACRQTARMDEHLATLNERAAAAADAWLTDPQDVQIYGRLVRAVHERRAHLHPALEDHTCEPDPEPAPPQPPTSAPASAPITVARADEVLDDLEDTRSVQSVGSFLVGADPRDVLERLRRSGR